MIRILTLATFFLFSSHAAWAAGTPQDMQAEIKKMQEAQARMISAMVSEKQSRLGFNETVTALQEAAKKRGWEVGPTMDMQEAMLKAGHKDAIPFTPCRVSVFEGNDGKVYIAKPNTEFMAQMATPVFAPLLQQFVEEEKAVLASMIK